MINQAANRILLTIIVGNAEQIIIQVADFPPAYAEGTSSLDRNSSIGMFYDWGINTKSMSSPSQAN